MPSVPVCQPIVTRIILPMYAFEGFSSRIRTNLTRYVVPIYLFSAPLELRRGIEGYYAMASSSLVLEEVQPPKS